MLFCIFAERKELEDLKKGLPLLFVFIFIFSMPAFVQAANGSPASSITIALDIGHNAACDGGKVGVKGITEDECTKKVGTLVKSKLKALGYRVVDCAPVNATSERNSLQQRTNKANASGADYFVSIHFNASEGGKGYGTEVYYTGDTGKKLASSVHSQIVDLGYADRGIKYNNTYYVLRNTAMPAILIECAFVDSASDMKKYNAEQMAAAICRGINSGLKPASNTASNKAVAGNLSLNKPVLRHGSTNYSSVGYLQRLLGVDSDGIFGPVTEKAVMKFQKRLGIMVDGIVGQQTWGGLLK
jgi:N-acetylmuramoyl-L-alanine amidase